MISLSLSRPTSLSFYFFSPVQLRRGSDRVDLVGTWHLARVNPRHSGISRVACGSHGYRRFLPFSVWVSCLIVGQEEVILGPNSVSERGKDTAGKKCLSPAEGGNIRDSFSLFHSRLPWSPRDTWREAKGGRGNDAGTGFWDRGSSWQVGSAAERQLCPGAAPLQSAAGLRALPAGTEGRHARKREV